MFVADQDDSGLRRTTHVGQVGRVGHDEHGSAVREEVRDLGLGRFRIEGYGDRGGPGDRQVALDGLDAVAQQDGHSVAAFHPQSGEVPGEPAGPGPQLGVGHGIPGVHVANLFAEAFCIHAK